MNIQSHEPLSSQPSWLTLLRLNLLCEAVLLEMYLLVLCILRVCLSDADFLRSCP